MKKYAWIVALFVLILVIVIYTARMPKDSIRIGVALGLSGSCAEWGEGELRGARLALDEANAEGGINGAEISFVVEDTQCENKTTVSAIHKLIEIDNVDVILGPTWGDAYQSAYSIIRNARMIAVSPDTALESLEFANEPLDYVFSLWPPQRPEIDTIQRFAKSQGITQFTIVWDQDAFSTTMARMFREQAPLNGINIIDEQEVAMSSNDFRTSISKIKTQSPQGVFISLVLPKNKASFLKQAKEQSLPATIFSVTDIQDEAVIKDFGSYMDGVIYTYPKTSLGAESFVKKYRATYGVDPQGPAAANAYDATRVLVELLKKDLSSGDEMQEELLSLSIPGTFIRQIDFNKKHQIQTTDFFELKTIKNGKAVRYEAR